MIAYPNEHTGLQDYRPQVTSAPPRRWPWLLPLAVLIGILGGLWIH